VTDQAAVYTEHDTFVNVCKLTGDKSMGTVETTEAVDTIEL